MPGERILVVDDTALVRNVTRRMLEAGGYEVLEATSAEEALATVRRTLAQLAAGVDYHVPETRPTSTPLRVVTLPGWRRRVRGAEPLA